MSDKKKQIAVLNTVIDALAQIGMDKENFAVLVSIRQTLKEYYKNQPEIITVNGTDYEATKAYKTGANAFLDGIPYSMNPFRPGSNANVEWGDGWYNESKTKTRMAPDQNKS